MGWPLPTGGVPVVGDGGGRWGTAFIPVLLLLVGFGVEDVMRVDVTCSGFWLTRDDAVREPKQSSSLRGRANRLGAMGPSDGVFVRGFHM